MRNLLLAVFAAMMVAFSFTAAPAIAEDTQSIARGKPGKVFWNVENIDDMSMLLRSGHQVCEGTKMQGSCITFSKWAGELTITNVGRQVAGVGSNFHSFRVIRATPQGAIMYDESGKALVNIGDVAKLENAAARWTTGLAAIPAAFANGGLAALVNATLGPCANGQCGAAAPSVAYAISGSAADVFQNMTVQGTGLPPCGASCQPAAPPPHPGSGKG